MKGKLLLTILLLSPLCCSVQTAEPDDDDDDEAPTCFDADCEAFGWCDYVEGCGCVPTRAQHCEVALVCTTHGGYCCLGQGYDGCPVCDTCS